MYTLDSFLVPFFSPPFSLSLPFALFLPRPLRALLLLHKFNYALLQEEALLLRDAGRHAMRYGVIKKRGRKREREGKTKKTRKIEKKPSRVEIGTGFPLINKMGVLGGEACLESKVCVIEAALAFLVFLSPS